MELRYGGSLLLFICPRKRGILGEEGDKGNSLHGVTLPCRPLLNILFWDFLRWGIGNLKHCGGVESPQQCIYARSYDTYLNTTAMQTGETRETTSNVVVEANSSLSSEQYRKKMQRRKEVQEQRVAQASNEKGLIIVNTGNGKGKTTAALGMVLRSLGHGYKVAIIQFIKGAWEPAEKRVFSIWQDDLLEFHALGEGFTWETQDRDRDIEKAIAAWDKALEYIRNPNYKLVLLDEINIALKLGYLQVEDILTGLEQKPPYTHVILTGRGAPLALIERADLVTEMTLVKHPFRDQGIKAQPGIEY